MKNAKESAARELDNRTGRQRLLAAALDLFPTEPLHPYGERSPFYQELVGGRAPEQRELNEVQGVLTARWALAARRWRKLLDDTLRKQGQSLIRWQALFQLAVNEPGETQTSIAARAGVTSAALVKLLDELEHDGLIERRIDANDRRSRLLALTPAGEQAVADMYDVIADLRRGFLEGISETEMLLMLDVANRALKNLDRISARSTPAGQILPTEEKHAVAPA